MSVSSAVSKELVSRYLQAISGQAKTSDLVARFVSDPGLAEHIRQVEAAFPAYELIPDDLVADGDAVAMRGTFRGVHRAEFAGIPATGRSVSAPLMIFYRVENHRIAAHWLQFDAGSVIAQLTQESAVHA